MKKVTICFPIRDNQILLGMKKAYPGGKGWGVGMWNGFGGHQNNGETIREVAIRELQEESGLTVIDADLEEVAQISFCELEKPIFDCSIFFTKKWEGVEVETIEMRPQWFEIAKIPYETMWVDDVLWLPLILGGKKIDVVVHFKLGMKEVESFEYTERKK